VKKNNISVSVTKIVNVEEEKRQAEQSKVCPPSSLGKVRNWVVLLQRPMGLVDGTTYTDANHRLVTPCTNQRQ